MPINTNLNDTILIWWASTKNEYQKSTKKYDALAELILISWMNKLVFANLLKKYQSDASNVEKIINNMSLEKAIEILKTII